MNVSSLLADLARRGIHLRDEDEQLVLRAPKGALTPESRAALAEHKAEVLARLRDGSGEPLFSFPLSYNQRSIWLLHRIAPASAAYNVAFAARVRSEVDRAAMRRTFQQLLDRHPSLRTTYALADGEPVQELRGRVEVCFEEVDATDLAEDGLRGLVVGHYRRPFDLGRGPLLRVSLFTRGARDHVLLITAHHIACDGSSLILLINEFGGLYPSVRDGLPDPLPALDAQYLDYVRWQSEMVNGAEGAQQWEFWRERLAGELPALDLPLDRPRPPVQRFNGASLPLSLGAGLTSRLRELAREEEATLYMILLAAFQTLLHRYSGQPDVLVGSSTFGRSQAGLARVVGHFVNPVVMRADFSGDPSFRGFLRQTRQTVLAALDHQDFPFLLLVERLQPARDAGRAPIFQVLFVLQRLHGFGELAELFKLGGGGETAVKFGGLDLAPFPLAQQEGQFDLRLDVGEAGGELFGVMQYNSDTFSASSISQMLAHLRTLLESAVADPDAPVSGLRFLAEDETRGRTERDFPEAGLSRHDFERLVMELGRAGARA